ncbi:hypothetical protein J4401_06350 [Candidatus Woesearchaeota archaeon]|nr:hypothetical protein [Candidatus Woesearchaeota archaeon]
MKKPIFFLISCIIFLYPVLSLPPDSSTLPPPPSMGNSNDNSNDDERILITEEDVDSQEEIRSPDLLLISAKIDKLKEDISGLSKKIDAIRSEKASPLQIPTIIYAIAILLVICFIILVILLIKLRSDEESATPRVDRLKRYVDKYVSAGYSAESIRMSLEKQGYPDKEINLAFRHL